MFNLLKKYFTKHLHSKNIIYTFVSTKRNIMNKLILQYFDTETTVTKDFIIKSIQYNKHIIYEELIEDFYPSRQIAIDLLNAFNHLNCLIGSKDEAKVGNLIYSNH